MSASIANFRYTALMFVLWALPGHAQSLIGTYGMSCGTFTGANPSTYQITLTQNAPLGSNMFVAVAMDIGLFQFTNFTVFDSVSSLYSNGAASLDNSGVSTVYDRYLSTGLSAGQVVGVHVDNNPGVRVCLLLTVFSNVVGHSGSIASGSGSSAGSTSPSVTSSAVSTLPVLDLMAVTFKGDPGTITTPGSATSFGKICSAGPAPVLCLYSAYKVPSVSGAQSVALTAQNSVPWDATIDAYDAVIFRNGFE
jgi:hypothetical protein